MRLSDIDLVATSGRTVLHRTSPAAKLLAASLVIAALVVTSNVLVAAALVACVLALVVGLGLPWRVLAAAAYPVFFALVFAFSTGAGVLLGGLIVAKATGAALSAVALVATTPYPQVFAPIQRVTPPLVGDALLFTYRSFFLLAEKSARLMRAIRLRAGMPLATPVASARLAGRALGGLLLYSVDLAQRDHDIMRLRGYDRRLRVPSKRGDSPLRDAIIVAGAAALLAVSVAWRVWFAVLNPAAWLPPAVALVLLVAAVVRRAMRPRRPEGT